MTDQNHISLSISVVCYYPAQEELKALIASLLAALVQAQKSFPLSSVKLFLIDNGDSEDWGLEDFELALADHRNLNMEAEIVRGHGNIGYGKGHNLAINVVASDFHLILNPDVVLDVNCLNAGIAYLLKNRNVVLVSPSATGTDGNKQYLCKQYPALFTFLIRGFAPQRLRQSFARRLARYEMQDLSELEPSSNIPIVSGCFMLCRTKSLQAVHGFDPGYFLYFEDFDLSLRIGKLGDISYLPNMHIQHAGGFAAKKGWRHLRYFVNSGLRFYATHGWRLLKQN